MTGIAGLRVERGGHVGLNVTNLDRSIAFYERAVGLDVLDRSSDGGRCHAFLGSGGDLLLTLWQQSSGRFSSSKPGLHHLSFQVADIASVRRAESTLRELGMPFHYDGVVRHQEGDESAGIFFEDPDGIRLEIYAPAGAGDEPMPAHAGTACGFF
jgi:catechol 2,3-dioxygenase-like lactoylglutathione lyase family enzyme